MSRMVYVTLDAPGGNITGVFGTRANLGGQIVERRSPTDPEVVAFEAVQPDPTVDDRIDSIAAAEGYHRGLLRTLSTRLPGNPSVADLIADIKTNK